MEGYTSSVGRLNAILHDDRVVTEVGVGTNAVSLVLLHVLRNAVSNVALVTVVCLSDVVGEFGLVEEGSAVFTIPDEHIAEGVLASEAVTNNVVTIDHQAGIHGVLAIVYEASGGVVGSPVPHVIDDGVTRVDGQHLVGLDVGTSGVGATDASKDVIDRAGVGRVTGITGLTEDEERVGSTETGLEEDASNSDTFNASNLDGSSTIVRDKSGHTHTEHNSVGVVDLDGLLKVVNTGLEHEV